MNKQTLSLKLLVLTGAGLVLPASAMAFNNTYDSDCKSCHGALKAGGGSVGLPNSPIPKTITAANILTYGVLPEMSFVKDVANGGAYSDAIRTSIAAEIQAGSSTPTPGTNSAKPILTDNLDKSYDVMVGEKLTLVLEAKDDDDDTVDVTPKPKPVGATITAGELSVNNLQTFIFEWTPELGQENKVYKVNFTAKENATKKKFSSKPIGTSIRVWPDGDRDKTSIKRFVLASAKWKNDKLTLKGTIQFNKLLTKEEKATYMTDAPSKNFTVTQGSDGKGVEILNLPTMTTTPNGGWVIADIDLPASPAFACSVSMSFEGWPGSRKIAGAPSDCLK